jgi:hypothetical protein
MECGLLSTLDCNWGRGGKWGETWGDFEECYDGEETLKTSSVEVARREKCGSMV